MVSRIDYKGLSWVDIQNPTADEIARVSAEFGLNPVVAEDLSKPTFRPRAENYGTHLFFILHLPLFDSKNSRHRSRELDIVAGKKFLITLHYDPIEPLARFFKALEQNLALREKSFEESPARLLYLLWRRLYEHLFLELDHIQKKVERVEERIFAGREKELIEDISLLRRDILDFLRSIRPHEIILDSIPKLGERFFGEDFLNYGAELFSRHRRLLLLIENQKDTLETLYATNDSLLTHRANEIIKTLTMLALMTFPLTLIAAIFSLNTRFLPIVGRPNDFWIIIGIMLATVLAMLTFFKYRKWI